MAHAVRSWNEWLTYMGVTLRISALGGEIRRQKYTRELSAAGSQYGLLSDEKGQVELEYVR